MQEAVTQTTRKLRGQASGSFNFHDYLTLKSPDYWSPWGVKEWLRSGAGLRSAWEAYSRDRSTPNEQVVFYDLTPDFQLARKGVGNLYTKTFLDQLQETAVYDVFRIPFPRPRLTLS